MRRYVLIILGVAALAWAVAAIVLGLRRASRSAPARRPTPRRRRATSTRPNARRSCPARTSMPRPRPAADTASPHTQISFLGAPAGTIAGLSVVGSASGHHAGRLAAYSQGDGASFLPAQPFRSRRARDGQQRRSAARPVSFSFACRHALPDRRRTRVPGLAGHARRHAELHHDAGRQGAGDDRDERRPRPGGRVTCSSPTAPGPGQYGPLIYTPRAGSCGSST